MPRLLIVDDDSDLVNLFRIILEDAGFDVVCYTGPVDAFTEFKSTYDLLLFDIKMPKMNGFELYKQIVDKNNKKHHLPTKRPKVIFITAFVIEYEIMKNTFGVEDISEYPIISKPITPDELVKIVNKVVNS